jgi:hypothetical protein|tara:strand:+ start:622 stop:840 length:219 start_codon:yes stop_codon:yes gene_type:complete
MQRSGLLALNGEAKAGEISLSGTEIAVIATNFAGINKAHQNIQKHTSSIQYGGLNLFVCISSKIYLHSLDFA